MCGASAICVIFKLLPGEQLGDSFNERERKREGGGERVGTTGDGCHVLQLFGFQSQNCLTRNRAQQANLPLAFRAKLLEVKHYHPLSFRTRLHA